MTETFYKDDSGLLLQGDALESLKTIPDESVDFCMTSPPYWGQRKYQSGTEVELGQEASFKDFVTNLSDIFDEVRRVLKPTGSMWVVINDTYFSTSKGTGGKGSLQDNSLGSSFTVRKYDKLLEPKSLCNIPYRLAIELTDNRNWIHRMSIIWHKEGAFPQPHGDKFTRNFENILVFTKNKQYYFHQLFEPFTDPKWAAAHPDKPGRNMRSVWITPDESDVWTINNNAAGKKHHATYPEELVRRAIEFGCPEGGVILDPFMGSGTTGRVAKSMGRSWIGCELNPEYCKTIVERINES